MSDVKYWFSGFLLAVGLWQLEMIDIHLSFFKATMFTLPFGVTVEWWFARDLFYGFIIFAVFLLLPLNQIKKDFKG